MAALRRVARYGDGWLPMNHTLDMLPASLHKLGTLWGEQGRSGRPQISIGLQVESVDDVRRMADPGIDRLIIAPWERTSRALEESAGSPTRSSAGSERRPPVP